MGCMPTGQQTKWVAALGPCRWAGHGQAEATRASRDARQAGPQPAAACTQLVRVLLEPAGPGACCKLRLTQHSLTGARATVCGVIRCTTTLGGSAHTTKSESMHAPQLWSGQAAGQALQW
ncbi:hypothetical protein ABPG77_008050 [Micractinium sp. CCAP 211/92]